MWKVTYYNNKRDKRGNYAFDVRGTFIQCHYFINWVKVNNGVGLSDKLFVELA